LERGLGYSAFTFASLSVEMIIVIVRFRYRRTTASQAANCLEMAVAASQGLFGRRSARLSTDDLFYISRQLPESILDIMFSPSISF
jgi:uncharacterized membrane protein YwaF